MASNSQELSLQDFQNFSDLDQEHEESGDTLNFLQNKLKRKSQESGYYAFFHNKSVLSKIEEVGLRANIQNQIKKLPVQQFPIVNNPYDLMNKQASEEKLKQPQQTNSKVQLEKEKQTFQSFPIVNNPFDLINQQTSGEKSKYNSRVQIQKESQIPISSFQIPNNPDYLNNQLGEERNNQPPQYNGKFSNEKEPQVLKKKASEKNRQPGKIEDTFNQMEFYEQIPKNNQILLQSSLDTQKKQSFLKQQNPSPKGVHQWMKETLDKQEYICYLSLRQELYNKRLGDIQDRFKSFLYSLNDWRKKLYEQADQIIEDYKQTANQILQQQEQAVKDLITQIDLAKHEVSASNLQQYTHIEPYYKPTSDCFDHLKDQFEQLVLKIKNQQLDSKEIPQIYTTQQYSPILIDKQQVRQEQMRYPSFTLSPPKEQEVKEPPRESRERLSQSPYRQLIQQQIYQAPLNQIIGKDKTPPRQEQNLDRLLQRLEAKSKVTQSSKSPNKTSEPHLRTYSTALLHQQQSCFREYSSQKKDKLQNLSDQKLGLFRLQTSELKFQLFEKQSQRSPYDMGRYYNQRESFPVNTQKTPNSKLLNPFQQNSRLVSPQRGGTNIFDAIYKQQNFFYDRRNNFK